ncbi:MAG: hypothetical protein LUQ54_03635 [Methanoregula sp.]|nr:hypothetical protein [Methanoregula sp.]
MGRVKLNFSESEFEIFYSYCSNYYRLNGDTRKNSIQLLVELYHHKVIDIQEHNLDNLFAYFYQKQKEFETESQFSTSSGNHMMRVRACADIISFLEDLEKIYVLIRKKGVEANYILVIGIFSKIINEKNQIHLNELDETASGAVDSIVALLGEAIERKLGPVAETPALLNELVRFVGTFNRLSPDLPFTDEIITLVAISLLKRFGKEADFEEVRLLFNEQRDNLELDELETVLEGRVYAEDARSLEFSWELLLEPLGILHEIFAQKHISLQGSLDVLSALESPLKIPAATATSEYSRLAVYHEPYQVMRRRNDENQFMVRVDNRKHSTIDISPGDFSFSGTPEHTVYKKYYSLTFGVMMLIIIILASVVATLPSDSVNLTEKTPVNLISTNNRVPVPSGALPRLNTNSVTPLPTVTALPTVKPVPQYVTIEHIIQERDPTIPISHQEMFKKMASEPDFLYNPKDYVSIFKNNMTYSLDNPYKISFDLKNPPMIIRYTVSSKNITDKKWFEPRDAQKKIDTAIIHRSDETAWFEIKIYNNESLYGTVGWGRLYGTPLTTQEIVLRTGDMYQLEFSGQKVAAEVEVLVKREGNINNF